MTIDEFNAAYSQPWNKLRSTAMFKALQAVMAARAPAKLNSKRPPADVLAGGVLWFSENQGHEALVDVIENQLGVAPAPKEATESDYTTPEV